MTDLLQVLPSLPVQPWSHLLHSLERAAVSVTDILSLDPLDIARHAQIPAREVRKLAEALNAALLVDLGLEPDAPSKDQQDKGGSEDCTEAWNTISVLDPVLDKQLGGGIPTGYLTEFTGEAGAAKTQFLFTLLLSAQLLPHPTGSSRRSSIYITTESALSTSRLAQILRENEYLSALPPDEQPSLNRVLSISIPDLEAQEHILQYQLPVAIERHNAGLVVIDSITANYRAEIDRSGSRKSGPRAMAQRSAALQQLGAQLRGLARKHNLAIVVANQVADRFERVSQPHPLETQLPPSSHPFSSSQAPPLSQEEAQEALDELMTLEHQQRWFTGWGDVPHVLSGLKTPSLGIVWANQVDARIVLTRSPWTGPRRADDLANSRWRRRMKIVFAPWTADCAGRKGIEFAVTGGGLKGIVKEAQEAQ